MKKKLKILLQTLVVLLFFFLISSTEVNKIAYAESSNWNPGFFCGGSQDITFTVVTPSVTAGSNNLGIETFTITNDASIQGKTFYLYINYLTDSNGDFVGTTEKPITVSIPTNTTNEVTILFGNLSPGSYSADIETKSSRGNVDNGTCTNTLPFKVVSSTTTNPNTTNPNSGLITGCEGLGIFSTTANPDDPTKGVTLTVINSTAPIKGKTLYVWIYSAKRTITTDYPIKIDNLSKTTATVQGNFQKGETYVANIGNQQGLGVNRISCASSSFSFTPPPIAVNSSTTITTDMPDLTAEVNKIVTYSIGIAGGIAFLLIIIGAFQIILSAGSPDRVKAGKEMITAALAGLFLIIFSVFILKLIGADILQIKDFTV